MSCSLSPTGPFYQEAQLLILSAASRQQSAAGAWEGLGTWHLSWALGLGELGECWVGSGRFQAKGESRSPSPEEPHPENVEAHRDQNAASRRGLGGCVLDCQVKE